MTLHLPDFSATQTVVAIGNFDGVHVGHQALIDKGRAVARDQNMPFIVLTFDPHPRRFFRPDSAPFIITSSPIKSEKLKERGADHIIALPFDHRIAELSAHDFIDQICRAQLNAHTIIIGSDFHFGHNRTGNADTFRAAGLQVIDVPLTLDHAGIPISSTRIRALLQQGDIENASAILGSPYVIRGTVERGDQRGRTLGFPTANIDMGDMLAPAHGIYAGWVMTAQNPMKRYMAAINIGHRPMFHTPRVLLEAHILDFSGDLYGQTLDILPVQKIRDEAKFDTIDKLISQMKKDCDFVRNLLEQSIQQITIL